MTMTQQLRSRDGTTITVDNTGEGPAVVLVDGAFGNRSTGPSGATAALLAPHYTVFYYDRRGRGASGDTVPYAVEREIEDLAAVIDEAGGSAFVFGTSSGGNLALKAAANGVPMGKLALWEPNFIVNDNRPPLPGDYVDQINMLVGADRRGDAVEYFMTTAVGMPAEFVAPMRAMPMWPALEAGAHTLAYDGTVVAEDMAGKKPSAEHWASVTVPTLVLDGGTTPWLTEAADALAAALPKAQRRTIAGQSHDVDPNALAPLLIEFLDEDGN
jgi:pimeloyl-ACP methyl ester carboxylesterase